MIYHNQCNFDFESIISLNKSPFWLIIPTGSKNIYFVILLFFCEEFLSGLLINCIQLKKIKT
ncbi:MAG: hypothetical protein CVU46_01365 [Chloroflexi bacterium HGW-Chloroflexi-8]|nr:MAG: hypothetical protein CVU46_01365 [Chloroflexi bacterium HGW-Chloroflexi-8]